MSKGSNRRIEDAARIRANWPFPSKNEGPRKILGNTYDVVIMDELSLIEHNWVFNYNSPHNNEDWYKCTKCGAEDWIATYHTSENLEQFCK